MAIRAMDFEVFGRVQGVFFRKITCCGMYFNPHRSELNYNYVFVLTCGPVNPPIKGSILSPVLYTITEHPGIHLYSGMFKTSPSGDVLIFLQYTKEQADRLGLRGWCSNTPDGTVLGHMQGPTDKIQTMMHWLKTTGSPSSKIDKAEFKNQKDISEFTFDDFGIIRDRD